MKIYGAIAVPVAAIILAAPCRGNTYEWITARPR